MIESILFYLWQSLSATFVQILVLFGPGLLLTLVLNFEIGFVQNRALKIIGRGWYLALFGWLGTIIHELGHALFCVIFGHKITQMKLFKPDPETGTLGYVKHTYNRTNIYQVTGNFFIGIGPILLGTAAVGILSFGLLGLDPFNPGINFSLTSSQLGTWNALIKSLPNLWNTFGHLLASIFSWQHLASWQFYVFIYLISAIGVSFTLSPPDIKAALGGFIVIIILIFIINMATIWAGDFITGIATGIIGYYIWFYTIIFLIMAVNLFLALILLPFSLLQGRRSKSA